MSSTSPWWRSAVVYQVYLRSFADGNGDGTGDIAGLRSRLRYIKSLGVDAIWVNPWYESPLNDGGYDVADYRSIHPLFGDLDQATELIGEARELGLRFLVDLVPNHTSSEHQWFRDAVGSDPGSPARDRYHFLDGKGPTGAEPPNNWRSIFGGPAWTRLPDGQWYLHLFDSSQPDLNWGNEDVRAEFQDILRFWLNRGASGFRVDVAHALVKESGYPDAMKLEDALLQSTEMDNSPIWDRDELHDVVREWRAVLDEYPETVMIAEAWVPSWSRLAMYLRPDEYHQAFDFHFLMSPWDPEEIRERVGLALTSARGVGSLPTWVLSNHDVVRHPTRYALPQELDARPWLLDGDRTLLDEARGLSRARAAALLMLALPGSAYLYQGEELGLPEVYDLPEEALDDPVWDRSGHTMKGRDGCRVPIPWAEDGPSFGFGAGGSWLPQPDWWGGRSVQTQEGDPGSTLELYRAALRIRGDRLAGDERIDWVELGDEVVAFRRGTGLICMVNFGDPVPLPAGEVLLSSHREADGMLPTDAAVWIHPA